MKIGIFTDSHYSSQELTCGKRYNSRSLLKIKEAYTEFEAQNCDIVICLGDLIDKEHTHLKEIENLKAVADVIKLSPIETVCLMGNHDAFAFTKEEFYEILQGCSPENKFYDGKNLIFLDACYFKNGKHYMPGDSDWTDTFLPDVLIFEKTLKEIDGETYIFIHQNIDPLVPENHRLFNADEINNIINKSKSVKAVYQGHYHAGKNSTHNGIEYIAVPAMCENEKVYFIIEI